MCINDAASETVQFSATILNTTGIATTFLGYMWYIAIHNTLIPYRCISTTQHLGYSAVSFDSRALTFDWSPVAPDCHTLHYNILSSNCGSCSTTTTNTTVTCTDVPTDGSMCTFAVQTVVCGNIVGNFSDSVNFTVTEDNRITRQNG